MKFVSVWLRFQWLKVPRNMLLCEGRSNNKRLAYSDLSEARKKKTVTVILIFISQGDKSLTFFIFIPGQQSRNPYLTSYKDLCFDCVPAPYLVETQACVCFHFHLITAVVVMLIHPSLQNTARSWDSRQSNTHCARSSHRVVVGQDVNVLYSGAAWMNQPIVSRLNECEFGDGTI